MKKIVVKSVAFNTLDPDQRKMLEHAKERTNFSSYIKRLIQRDLDGVPTSPVVVEEQDHDDFEGFPIG